MYKHAHQWGATPNGDLPWQLPFNESKCKVLHVSSLNPEHNYKMRDTQLKESYSERDLGVEVDGDLKFCRQAAFAVTRASQILALIRRSFQLIDCVTLPLLFKTLVQSHLESAARYGVHSTELTKNLLSKCSVLPQD